MLGSLFKDLYRRGLPKPASDAGATSGPAAHERWTNDLLLRMFRLMHHFEQDNFDAARYRDQPENTYFADQHAAYFGFFLKNVKAFFHARQLLQDEGSRELYDQLILFRVLGHLHVRLAFNTPDNRASIATAEGWHAEDTKEVGPFVPLSIYIVPGSEGQLRVKVWKENIAWTFLYRQYFFDRGEVHICPTTDDHVIDAGGCFG